MVRAVPENVLEKIVATIPVGRLGRPEEIAKTILSLVADYNGFMTGSTLSVNGCQPMHSKAPMSACASPWRLGGDRYPIAPGVSPGDLRGVV
jgi:hypothetical protein